MQLRPSRFRRLLFRHTPSVRPRVRVPHRMQVTALQQARARAFEDAGAVRKELQDQLNTEEGKALQVGGYGCVEGGGGVRGEGGEGGGDKKKGGGGGLTIGCAGDGGPVQHGGGQGAAGG